MVDANQFEDKVRQAAEEENHDNNHARLVFPASKVGCRQENDNGDGNSRNRQSKLGVRLLCDDDDKLNDEAQEEEEIELEEGDVNLQSDCQLIFLLKESRGGGGGGFGMQHTW